MRTRAPSEPRMKRACAGRGWQAGGRLLRQSERAEWSRDALWGRQHGRGLVLQDHDNKHDADRNAPAPRNRPGAFRSIALATTGAVACYDADGALIAWRRSCA